MTVSAAGIRSTCYWRPDPISLSPISATRTILNITAHSCFDIVRRHSRSYAPLACEVSGGLDSSAIFSVAEHLRRDSKLLAPGLQGFTLAFHDDKEANEVSYARAVGEHLGLKIREVVPAPRPLAWYVDHALHSRNLPGFPNVLAVSLYKPLLEDGHRVVLGGLGGDEFLTGSYAYYLEELTQGNLSSLGRCLVQDVRMIGVPLTLRRIVHYGLKPLVPLKLKRLVRPIYRRLNGVTERKAYWLTPRMQAILNSRREKFRRQPIPAFHRRGEFSLLFALDYAFDAFACEFWESLNARHNLEYRHPLLARELIEFAFVTPDRLRLIGNQDKLIHVESLRTILPEKVRTRQTKADFSCTFKMILRPLREHLVTHLPQARPQWFDKDGMENLWKVHLDQPQAGWHNWPLWGSLGIDLAMKDKFN